MTKLIIKESNIDYQRWNLPIVEDMSAAVASAKEDKTSGLMTAEQIKRIQSQAYKEAYDAGLQKGLQAGENEITRQLKLVDDLLQSLTRPFQQLDDEVEQELIALALAVARQLVRRELKSDPGQVVAVVHEALSVLPVGSRDINVCLHPDDVVVVRELLAKIDEERHWTLMDDPSLDRGDCRIRTATSQVDATLEKRLAAVVAQLFGDRREHDEVVQSGSTESMERK